MQLRGEIKSKWAKLTDDDLKNVGAKRDALVGKLQERYGLLKEAAEKQVDEWIDQVGRAHKSHKSPAAPAQRGR
jgi:uncharacterized protein YjbJ (UPF0337 family)